MVAYVARVQKSPIFHHKEHDKEIDNMLGQLQITNGLQIETTHGYIKHRTYLVYN